MNATRPGSAKESGAWSALEVIDWGRTRYDDALARQHDLVRRRLAGEVGDALVLTEHDPVITLGRGARAGSVLDPSAEVVTVERGGEATWHGPGQVVGYAIRLLPPEARDLVAHLRGLERLIIDALAALGVAATTADGCTGVWIEKNGAMRKIASIGVAARRWCTFHGFALNVDCDLAAFRAINPCGFDASVMTSVRDVLGTLSHPRRTADGALGTFSPGIDAVKDAIRARAFARTIPG